MTSFYLGASIPYVYAIDLHRRVIYDVLHDRNTANARVTTPPPSCAIDDIHYNVPADHPHRARLHEIRLSFFNADGTPDDDWNTTCDRYIDTLALVDGARDETLYPIVTEAKAGQMNRNAASIENVGQIRSQVHWQRTCDRMRYSEHHRAQAHRSWGKCARAHASFCRS